MTAVTRQRDNRRDYWSLAIMLAYLVGVRLLIATRPEMFRSTSQAAVFAWPALGIIAAIAFAGTWLLRRTQLPEMWDRRVPLSWRLGVPAAAGVGIGILAIAIDRMTGWSGVAAARMGLPSIHIDWPASLAIYPGGAIIVSIVYFLLIIPLVLWIARGRGFWVVAILAAAIEPAAQDLDFSAGIAAGLLVFAQDYLLNIGQVWLFRRAGFVPAVLLRVAFYLVWHIAGPALL